MRDGLLIMLHMVLDRAIADERNQQYIREHCVRYPNARLVLAHAARGFCGAHTVEGGPFAPGRRKRVVRQLGRLRGDRR